MRPTTTTSAHGPPGVIDTLTAGFDRVNRVLWVLLLPILMDAFLWLAPPLHATTVFHGLAGQANALYSAMASNGVDPNTLTQARQAVTAFDQAAGGFNVFTLLVVSLASVPSILPTPVATASWQLTGVGALIGAAVGLELLGMLIGCLYLAILAQQVRDNRVTVARLGRAWFYWLSVLGFLVLALGVSLAISIPLALVIGVVQVVIPGLGQVLWVLALAAIQVAAILMMIYLFFLVDAIVVSEVGPWQAAVKSAQVVANNFWPTVGFIVLVYVISLGMQVIWTAMGKTLFGTGVAIVANAYVASGLTAASMLFYQTRVSRLPAVRGVLGRATQA
jgi:hypothetical protein